LGKNSRFNKKEGLGVDEHRVILEEWEWYEKSLWVEGVCV